ncbi:hypothetical protein GHL01_04080 [Sinorhizobium meliloti]|nr:hypothetical protein [Sinorhizobium meliloti]
MSKRWRRSTTVRTPRFRLCGGKTEKRQLVPREPCARLVVRMFTFWAKKIA